MRINKLFELMEIYHVEPLSITENGNKSSVAILLLTDYKTKWMVGSPNIKATTMIVNFIYGVINKTWIKDRLSVTNLMDALCEVMGTNETNSHISLPTIHLSHELMGWQKDLSRRCAILALKEIGGVSQQREDQNWMNENDGLLQTIKEHVEVFYYKISFIMLPLENVWSGLIRV